MNRRPFIKSIALGTPVLASSRLFADSKIPGYSKSPIKPPKLKSGDLVTLIAPGGPVTEEKILKAEKNIQSLGFKTKQSKNLKAIKKHTAGTDSQRLEDLHTAFSDPNTKAIWCVRGGDGCNRLLPLLDYDLIVNNPKPLLGFSDITALITGIFNKTGLVGFHAPIASWNFTDYNVENLTKVLVEGDPNHLIRGTKRTTSINNGKTSGQLVGGNLSLLAALAGTDYDNDYSDKIVFIEDVGEAPRRIDRMLTQLIQTSNLKNARGIIFGEFDGCYDATLKEKLEKELETSLIDLTQNLDFVSNKKYLEELQEKINKEIRKQDIRSKLNEDLKDTISDRFFRSWDIPVLYDFPFSHNSSKEFCTFPVGIEVELNATKMHLKFLESAVV